MGRAAPPPADRRAGHRRAGGGHTRTGPRRRRPGRARPDRRDRLGRARLARGRARGDRTGRSGRLARTQARHRDGGRAYRTIPCRPAASDGRSGNGPRCAVSPAGRADPAGRALRAGRIGSAFFDRADAGRSGPRSRLRTDRAVHPSAERRKRSPRRVVCGVGRRRPAHIQGRRSAGDRSDGLRHAEHPARRQDFRTGQPVRHGCQAAGRLVFRCDRYAGRAFRSARHGRFDGRSGIRGRRPAVAGRARARLPDRPAHSVARAGRASRPGSGATARCAASPANSRSRSRTAVSSCWTLRTR